MGFQELVIKRAIVCPTRRDINKTFDYTDSCCHWPPSSVTRSILRNKLLLLFYRFAQLYSYNRDSNSQNYTGIFLPDLLYRIGELCSEI